MTIATISSQPLDLLSFYQDVATPTARVVLTLDFSVMRRVSNVQSAVSLLHLIWLKLIRKYRKFWKSSRKSKWQRKNWIINLNWHQLNPKLLMCQLSRLSLKWRICHESSVLSTKTSRLSIFVVFATNLFVQNVCLKITMGTSSRN